MSDFGSTKFIYEKREVQVQSIHLASGEWDVKIWIAGASNTGGDEWSKSWSCAATFDTKEKALSYGRVEGKRLVNDGVNEPSPEVEKTQ